MEKFVEDLFTQRSVSTQTADDFRSYGGRHELFQSDGTRCKVDKFDGGICCFIRLCEVSIEFVTFTFQGQFQVQKQAAGGWVLHSVQANLPVYWVPCAPKLRQIDEHGRILKERNALIQSFGASAHQIWVELEGPKSSWILDFVIWRFDSDGANWLEELGSASSVERQPTFIYGSHTLFRGPQDLYRHLVFGSMYEDIFAWPKKWKIPDELDAYGLYLTLAGLEQATGKRLYSFLKRQIVYSVIGRQHEDGGWYHGEWTEGMECHVRLHCGGMHLLATAFEEDSDPLVARALGKAAGFLSSLVDRTELGAWFLHDTLELSRAGMNQAPFPWLASRTLGKTETNMLVLNTHLDSLIALDRYRRLTHDSRFDDLIASGQRSTAAILARHPAEGLYKILYRLIDLTLLPAAEARRLPLPVRALKRLTWKYLIPRMHHIRTRWPRLVMPNGFIDRALSLRGVSHVYQSVNIWDLIRYRRRFPEQEVSETIERALAYTQNSPLRAFWAQEQKKGHALAFWTDALWHLCMSDPNPEYRRWLGEAMLYCEDAGIGMPPALLGANPEAVPVSQRMPCPSPIDTRLRIANLGRMGRLELVLVNPSDEDIHLALTNDAHLGLNWSLSIGQFAKTKPIVPARGWAWGQPIQNGADGVCAKDRA